MTKLVKTERELTSVGEGMLEKALEGSELSSTTASTYPPADWVDWKSWGDVPRPTQEEWEIARGRWLADRDSNDASDGNWDFKYLITTYNYMAWWRYFYPDAIVPLYVEDGKIVFDEKNLGKGIAWDTVDPVMTISTSVSFMSAMTFDMTIFGKSVK